MFYLFIYYLISSLFVCLFFIFKIIFMQFIIHK